MIFKKIETINQLRRLVMPIATRSWSTWKKTNKFFG